MSRTINFRGKRFDNGQWAYGNLIIDDSGNCEIVDYKNNQEIRYDVRRETIGKFGSGYIRTTNKAFLQAAIEVIEEIDSHLVEVNEKN